MRAAGAKGEPCAEIDQWHQSRPGTEHRWLLRLESRSSSGGFSRPRALGVRNLTDKFLILCRMTREPAVSGECQLIKINRYG